MLGEASKDGVEGKDEEEAEPPGVWGELARLADDKPMRREDA